MPANHCKPHTEESKAKMSAARLGKPLRWGYLDQDEIVERLLLTSATIRSIAQEVGCSESTIKLIFRNHTTFDQRITVKNAKAARSKLGKKFELPYKQRTSPSPMIGRKASNETRTKQSLSKLGKRQSLQRRIAKSAKLQGISPSEWSGFASEKTAQIKRSFEYREWRKNIFSRDKWTCQDCGVIGGNIHAHHIKPKSLHPELIFDVDNGLTLCVTCHKKTNSYGLSLSRIRMLSLKI